MKKVIVVVLSIFMIVGCSLLSSGPTKKTEEFFKKYQNLDDSVLKDLELVVEGTTLSTEKEKSDYTKAMKMQYSDLKYKITNEKINGDEAVVTAKISVYDFYKVQTEANKYKTTHESDFMTDNKFDEEKFMEYKLKQMMNTAERVEYTIDISLTKKDNEWTINELDKTTLEKIHGTYNYESE